MFEIPQLMSLNIPIFIIIIGVIFLYFGRIIGSTKVEKYDKTGYYTEGLLFFAIYVYTPTLLAYYIYSKYPFTISSSVSIGIQGFIVIFLFWNLIINELKRNEMLDLDEIKKKAKEKQYQILEHFRLNTIDYTIYLTKIIDLVFDTIPIKIFGYMYILIFFSFLTIISNIKLYESWELLILGFSLLFAFLIFTLIALAYGFSNANHPLGKIYMDNDNIIEGKILKFDEYVLILKDDKRILINKDKINFVEESKIRKWISLYFIKL